MIIEREESWGTLLYDAKAHRFSLFQRNGQDAIPYACDPVVLNIDLTMKCNMACRHCVTKDFEQIEGIGDLVVSPRMLDWINKSRLMVVVITGGEPFLAEYEHELMTLLRQIHGKGLIVDTNGTIYPSRSVINTLLQTNTLVRVSWDSVNPNDEIYFRQVKPATQQNRDINVEHYNRKLDSIQRLRLEGINVAIQSVVHRNNRMSIVELPAKLHDISIKQWYVQRFVPSHQASDKRFGVSDTEYDLITTELAKRCKSENIECIVKKDKRHNSVILLVGDGAIYTQGEKPGKKIPLGTIDSEITYSDYVSLADHCERYYE